MDLGISLRRAIARGGVALGAALLALGLSAAAYGEPSATPTTPPDVRLAQLTGDNLPEMITISSVEQGRLYTSLAQQVEWLANQAAGNASAPEAGKAGTKITLVLTLNGQPKQAYDLYPQAPGGPRVFRPAAQPDGRKVTDAWFLGRLTMASTLHGAGVPLDDVTKVGTGGGGGIGVEATADPAADMEALLGDWQRFVGLNGAVVVFIAIGVFGIAYLIRRRV